MSSKAPIISVLVAAQNEELHIGRAIRSILSQSIDSDLYEVVVVNDGSTDNTSAVLRSFADDIRLFENETNQGLPASLNTAIHNSKGKYIIRLDADDFVHKEYLYLPYLFLEMNTDMDAVACDYVCIDEHENVISRHDCLEDPIACGIMFRSEHLISIGMYDDSFLMHEDRDLRIRFQEKYSIHRIPLPLYRYRKHDGNMTSDEVRSSEFEDKLKGKHVNASS